MPKVGAHVSAAVSLDLALDRAKEIGAEAIQIFVSPPRQWSMLEHTEEEFKKFKRKTQEYSIGANFKQFGQILKQARPERGRRVRDDRLKY